MKIMRIKTNKGKVHDWIMNWHINFILWLHGIKDDEDSAIETASEIINKYYK